ncbi:MAG: hypothetical protein KDA58_11690, partial [Planctomycetaceae bacterium]|nr:hypothetical protein [Planctomycetaceae bacterium]
EANRTQTVGKIVLIQCKKFGDEGIDDVSWCVGCRTTRLNVNHLVHDGNWNHFRQVRASRMWPRWVSLSL